jgi:phosphatidylglycerol lysyltransferase
MKLKSSHIIGPLLGLILFTASLWVLHNQLRTYHFKDIINHFHALPARSIYLAFILTFFNYLTLTAYDTLALQYIKRKLSYLRTAFASFIGYAFSNNIGLSMIAGASARLRIYTSWGLTAFDITQIIGFCSLTLWLGFFTMGGVFFLIDPIALPEFFHLPFNSIQGLGVIFLLLVILVVSASIIKKKPFKISGWEFSFPPPRLIFSQIVVASLDWTLVGAILFVLLPSAPGLSFSSFIGLYLTAQLVGMLSQVPGGLGVFESIIMLLLKPYSPPSLVLGSLFAFRVIYYIVPFVAAILLLAAHEIYRKRTLFKQTARALGAWNFMPIPQFLSLATFLSGAILLFSGATPGVGSRLSWLKDLMPLPVIEVSHFLGSLVGGGLLILASGLQRRIDAAYFLAISLLTGGIIFSLLKGLDYEEAIILSAMLAAFIPSRRYFHRSSSLFGHSFTAGWIAGIAAVIIFSVWLGFFSFKHVEYTHDLWWRFAFHSDASRFLRATVGIMSLMLFFILARLMSPAKPKIEVIHEDYMSKAEVIVNNSPKTTASLAMLGDKSFLFSQEGNAFIMYGVEGRSWICMGDPVGKEDEYQELIWQFREAADRYHGWSVFYEVSTDQLPLYLDLGLSFFKLGEEARVNLEGFTLDGGDRKEIRHLVRKLEKEGYYFQIASRDDIPKLFSELKTISDAWLDEKNTAEKRFSLGFYDETYLKYFPMALVKKEEKIKAFSNLWTGFGKEELSVDLMRFAPDSEDGIMKYLFTQIMLWGKQEGYRWFNLGMAPLSGLENRSLAPLWNRVGTYLFKHGEHFYNFQGLRQYKNKFDPIWKPKYLVCPGGLALPRILTNIVSITSGGIKGVINK